MTEPQLNEWDELKAKWAEHDRKLDEIVGVNRQLLSAMQRNGARSRLQRLLVVVSLHAAAWIVSILAVGEFIYEHLAVPRFALPAVALEVYAIGFMIALVWQITLIRGMDLSQPVAAVQQNLESVRILRIRITQWGVLAGTVVWVPFLIVVSNVLFGADVYRLFGPLWLTANVLFGMALIPLALWISKKFALRMAGSPVVQRLMRDLAGDNLNAATEFLATLK